MVGTAPAMPVGAEYSVVAVDHEFRDAILNDQASLMHSPLMANRTKW
jgi:hypothetical protein